MKSIPQCLPRNGLMNVRTELSMEEHGNEEASWPETIENVHLKADFIWVFHQYLYYSTLILLRLLLVTFLFVCFCFVCLFFCFVCLFVWGSLSVSLSVSVSVCL